jgi:membrane protein YdbS with pleckstrin-like domain
MLESAAMDFAQPPIWISFASAFLFIFQLMWSVGVIVMLYRIWRKVKHLPG